MISRESISEVLQRVDIVDVIGSFVRLKKRGANYLGLCPFHHEKTPSFTVSPSKEIYKCFGCGRSGNVISFLMEHEKLSYVEAIRWLAQRYHVELEETAVSPEWKEQQMLADSLFIINHFAQEFFTQALLETDEGRHIGLSYLQERGLREHIIQKFQLGYNPENGDAFARAALDKGYNAEYLLKTGLIARRAGAQGSDFPYRDPYAGRIIFPVHNLSGKVAGFGARSLRNDPHTPKYINTPENEIYVKSKILYGLYQARQAIGREDECLLVEGYMDVLAMHQAGIENTVASSGTSLTTDQLQLIRKLTRRLTIVYDGDAAGIKAAQRGMDLALEQGLDVRLVLLPDGEDPDSFVHKHGAQALREFISSHKKDIILFQLETAAADVSDDIEKKSALINQIAATLAHLQDSTDFLRRQDYIRRCSQLLHIDEQGLTSLVNTFIREQLQRKSVPAPTKAESQLLAQTAEDANRADTLQLLQHDQQQEKGLIKILLKYGHLPLKENYTIADFIFNQGVQLELIEHPIAKMIMLEYQQLHEKQQTIDLRHFLYHENPEIGKFVAEVLNLQSDESLSENWEQRFQLQIQREHDMPIEQAIQTVHHLKMHKLKKMIADNLLELQQAQTEEEMLHCIQLHQQLKALEKQLAEATGTVIYH
ncbi:MAG: DNA primase [Thermoflavifilum aggregans]|nr:DNA primase [Thermoflavifilum aggregans]